MQRTHVGWLMTSSSARSQWARLGPLGMVDENFHRRWADLGLTGVLMCDEAGWWGEDVALFYV